MPNDITDPKNPNDPGKYGEMIKPVSATKTSLGKGIGAVALVGGTIKTVLGVVQGKGIMHAGKWAAIAVGGKVLWDNAQGADRARKFTNFADKLADAQATTANISI